MLVILAAGGTVVATAWRWVHQHPGRIEEQLKALIQEAYLELDEESVPSEDAGSELAPLSVLTAMDTHFQRFMAEKVDPLLSRTKRDDLAEITSVELVVSEDERQINRYLGVALVGMGSAAVGLVDPRVLVITLGTALYCAVRLIRQAYHTLVDERKLGMPVMGALYVVAQFAKGIFLPGMFGLTVWFLSQKLVLITQDRSRNSLITIFGEQPRTVWLVSGDIEVEVPIANVHVGDTAVIQAGQVVPVDGVIIRGFATIDEHALTGESQPAEKGEGDRVLTSTLMVGGKAFVRVERTGEETLVAQIGLLLQKTASYQSTVISKGQKIADQSVPPSLAMALIALRVSGYRYMVTILGSSIGLNILITAPISMLNFLNVAASHGVLIKDGRSLELLNDVDVVVFDKTGTLTTDQPQVARVHPCGGLHADTVLAYAAAAEHRQTHPIARAILKSANDRGLMLPSVESAHYEMGFGLRVRIEDRLIRVGSRRYMDLEDVVVPSDMQDSLRWLKGRATR